ncbi:MAG: acetyl/propionyl-CoA carboxylase alpha subunit/acetyl-CoA carboxylase carboxyltransferase component [Candidatus Poriferisodalaceae bacterium]|jgi:acetyl/propionyl-CoA carboxylase alpha subunit/acetyl-CoA carboxylase carboxyltransferase component
MESVAVYAPADSQSLHSAAADVAVELAAGDPIAAYLDAAALVTIATEQGCDCVHPGYGFLSENAEFAQMCADAGITFVGPSPDALALFGDKVRARDLAESAGVPIVPGTVGAVGSAAEAADVIAEIGLPVMMKAAAGGGGRGMREVHEAADVARAFERCSSEAAAAFGNGAVFIEKLIVSPRHIEVQVLGDSTGNIQHLFERDCSVQQRNQKVVEIAPAAGLDTELRASLHSDAIALVGAAGYVNAGTVEFLVSPESGEYWFIECNPRIQVEHTITEEVMGIDLVELQFLVAGGATLVDLGLGDPAAIGSPRGYAVQARVVATGGGTIAGYKEPTGVGVRVDGSGYAGYRPAPQFDPLLAKVICRSGSAGTLDSAVDRTARALAEFQVSGLSTNLGQLAAILAEPSVRAGDARTTMLASNPSMSSAVQAPSDTVSLLDAHSGASGAPATSVADVVSSLLPLPVEDGQVAIKCPMASSVIEVKVEVGDTVSAGDALMVITAMKMETEIAASSAGTVMAVQPVGPGDQLAPGDILVVLAPDSSAGPGEVPSGENTWQPLLDEVKTLQGLADERLSERSEEPGVVRQRNRGKLDCRQRIELLLDDGSFREVGSLAGFASYNEFGDIEAFTPANHVGGTGTIEGRPAIVCADDFTSRGGHADGAIGAKSFYLDQLSVELGIPSIRLLDGSSGGGSVAAMVPQQKKEGDSSAKESSGAIKAGRPRVSGGGGSFLPGHLGSTEYAAQLASVPVINMLLGSVVGIGAAKAVLGHFSVMVRDISQLFVAGPPVVSHAMSYEITKEDLGDWRIHCTNGSVDNLAESEDEAVEMARKFLSYLPANVDEAPPVLDPNPDDPADRRDDELFTIVPRKRTMTFDIRRAIELIADSDSFFEIGPLWATDQVTGFVRMNGHPMGVIASDSRHVNGGALTADGCDKLTRHIDLCDLFHIPILNLCDNPGFAVGLEHEKRSTIRKGGQWMVAFAQCKVPIFTVLMRRSFGVAGNNYATPRREPNSRVVWPAADVGGIPPEGGIEAAYKRQLAEAEDPAALRAELNERIEAARGPIGPLNRFQMEEMIDPRDTRRLVCEWVPNAYRRVNQPARLGSRNLAFRP